MKTFVNGKKTLLRWTALSFQVLLFLLITLLGSAPLNAQTGSANSFTVEVPKRGAGSGSVAIFQVEATIVMESSATVDFRVTDPEGETADFSLDASINCADVSEPCQAEFPDPGTGFAGDFLTWEVPTAGAADDDDPENVIYKLTINPFSNTDFVSFPGECVDSMPVATETYTIEVVSGPGITGACLLSYDLTAMGAECNNIGPPIVVDPISTINGGDADDQFCQQLRPGVDSALVLDKSGSMNSSPQAGPSATKMDALKVAVNKFVNRFTEIRAAEALSPNDNVGVILFDSNESWLGGATGLAGFDAVAPSISGDMAVVTAGGATSIGDGLFTASDALFDGALAANGNRKTILLMSDGKENTFRRVRLWDTDTNMVLQFSDIGTISDIEFESRIRIELGSDSDGWVPLANEDDLRIYAVTVGSSTAVSAEINQGLAQATGGFYINSETNADILSAYFIELLQNFVKFNTWNVVALRSGNVLADPNNLQNFQLNYRLPSTATAISVDVNWNPAAGIACLEVTGPPNLTLQEVVCGTDEGQVNGQLQFSRSPIAQDAPNDWQIRVIPQVPVIVDVATNAGAVRTAAPVEFPVFVVVMSEDSTVKSDFSIGTGDFIPGSQVPLRVQLKESGRPLTENVAVSALVAAPDQSIGDLLSASDATTDQPGNCPNGCDTDTDADAKLANELNQNTTALQPGIDNINLLDNGDPNNGDLVAGDGIYSGLYLADVPGHYNVLFNGTGNTERSGDFRREQLISVLVRNQPDFEATTVSTDVVTNPDTGQQTLNVVFTPATVGGHLLGPGWANYFWLIGPDIPPTKSTDRFDGTYSAAINFTGDTPPAVTLHFLDVAQAIEDSTTFEQLPLQPVDDGTALGPVTPGDGMNGGGQVCRFYDFSCGPVLLKYIVLIIIILLILFLILRRRTASP